MKVCFVHMQTRHFKHLAEIDKYMEQLMMMCIYYLFSSYFIILRGSQQLCWKYCRLFTVLLCSPKYVCDELYEVKANDLSFISYIYCAGRWCNWAKTDFWHEKYDYIRIKAKPKKIRQLSR